MPALKLVREMKRSQRTTLIVVAVIVASMMLAPPWHDRYGGVSYHWLWSERLRETPNVGLLLVQWIGILIVGAIVFALQGGEVAESQSREPFWSDRRKEIAIWTVAVAASVPLILLVVPKYWPLLLLAAGIGGLIWLRRRYGASRVFAAWMLVWIVGAVVVIAGKLFGTP